MLKMIALVSVVIVSFVAVLTVTFDLWVYFTTKDINFVLRAWMERYKAPDPRLLPKQVALRRVICVIERGLKFFLYLIIFPMLVFLVFKLIVPGVKNG